MELRFDKPVKGRPVIHRQRRLSQAGWWFQQMRTMVANAVEWGTLPPACAEQRELLAVAGRPAHTAQAAG